MGSASTSLEAFSEDLQVSVMADNSSASKHQRRMVSAGRREPLRFSLLTAVASSFLPDLQLSKLWVVVVVMPSILEEKKAFNRCVSSLLAWTGYY